jgi:hypothetical protein
MKTGRFMLGNRNSSCAYFFGPYETFVKILACAFLVHSCETMLCELSAQLELLGQTRLLELVQFLE